MLNLTDEDKEELFKLFKHFMFKIELDKHIEESKKTELEQKIKKFSKEPEFYRPMDTEYYKANRKSTV